MVLAATAVWLWRQLDNRIANNELQQTQTDTFMGAQRESLDAMRQEVQRHANSLTTHLDNYTAEVNVPEESIHVLH